MRDHPFGWLSALSYKKHPQLPAALTRANREPVVTASGPDHLTRLGMEHRCGQRRVIRRYVHLRTRSGLIAHGRLCDVSLSGAFIETHLPVLPLSQVLVSIVSENGDRHSVAIEAQVVRGGLGGIAVEWMEFAPEPARDLMLSPEPVQTREPAQANTQPQATLRTLAR